MQPEKQKNLLLIAGATLGVAIGCVSWLVYAELFRPQYRIPEDVRKRLGYSPQEAQAEEDAVIKLIPKHGISYAEFSEEQFRIAETIVKTDKKGGRQVAILSMGGLRKPEQQQRALTIINTAANEPQLQDSIRIVLMQYRSRNKALFAQTVQSNTTLSTVAQEIVKDERSGNPGNWHK